VIKHSESATAAKLPPLGLLQVAHIRPSGQFRFRINSVGMNPYKTGPRQALYFCFRIWVRVRILALAHQLQMLGWGVVRMVIGREVLSPLPLCPPHFLHGPTTPGVKAAISGEKPATDGLIYRIANLFVYSRQYRNTRTYKHSLSCV
jgi:hypothetical protein